MYFSYCRQNDVAGIDVNMGCPKEFSVKVLQHLSSLKKRVNTFYSSSPKPLDPMKSQLTGICVSKNTLSIFVLIAIPIKTF